MYNMDYSSIAATRQAEWEREVRAMQLSKRVAEGQISSQETPVHTRWTTHLSSQLRQIRNILAGAHVRSA